jgi:2-dehydropantoate 2-reductase
MEVQHICVYGLGGIGGSVGGLLAHKIAGEPDCGVDISFIARGEHLRSIRENGLQLHLPNNVVLISKPTFISSAMTDVPAPDIVFVGVKAYDSSNVAQELQSSINDHTVIIPLLNGFDIYQRMRRFLTKGYISPTSIYFGGRKFAPGKVKLALPGTVFYGNDPELGKIGDDVISTITKLFEGTPLTFRYLEDPYQTIWMKYILNIGLNLVMAYSGKVLGEILVDPRLKQMFVDIMEEATEIARTQYPSLPQDTVTKLMGMAEKFPCQTKSSFAVDIESNAPHYEGEIFGDAIISLGKKVGKPVTTIQTIYQNIQDKPARNNEG